MNEGRNEIYQDAVILSGTEPCPVERVNNPAASSGAWNGVL